MIFSSLAFVLGFLPLALIGYALASRLGFRTGNVWLILVSLLFYGMFAPYLTLLISISILFNFAVSIAIRRNADAPQRQSALLWLGIGANLTALVYYKYAFAVLTWLALHGVDMGAGRFAGVILPLGISFFTFTQIGYLVDCRDGVSKSDNFLDYLLFVTFFPHLVAGPIVHNGDLMPQFADPANRGLQAKNFAPALTLFIIGMVKKALIADPLSGKVALGFAHAGSLSAVNAWITSLSYSFQLYFDFSGYSDMAIALAMMFNVRFPANFNSPYKARSIIDFWQRWHISLTRYLNQYLYNPIAMSVRRARMARGLPMNRKAMSRPGAFATLVAWPTLATMGLAGIWHGAGLQFLVFGLLHGLYLTINHAWRAYGPKAPEHPRAGVQRGAIIAGQVLLTYLAVLLGQIFFRAASVEQALDMLGAMLGRQTGLGGHTMLGLQGDDLGWIIKLAVFFGIVWLLPNSLQIMASANPVINLELKPAPSLLLWRPSVLWALATGALGFIGIMALGGTTEFLYFQF